MFPQIFGKYVLERELASGGMARVYLATLRGAVGFEKRLVVKQIRPELASDQAFVRRFVEEAKTTVELSHPNIVPVYELGVEHGVYYIAMELCAGVTLAELLANTGALSAEEGAYLGVEICRALDYAHRRAGVVHRDVTPRNVLIDEEGAIRLIDFGIAAPVTAGGVEVFGSPGHMPPEQLAGRALSPATDVFAVTVLLVEAWTGKPVFRRATARESERALREPVAAVEDTVPALASLAPWIARGLALDAQQRPTQAEQLARPLRDFLRSVDVGDVARRLGERVRRSAESVGRAELLGSAATRDSARPRGAPSQSEPSTPAAKPPEPTHTFAARQEVSAWTRPFGSERPPPAEGAVGTRKIPSLAPPPSAAPTSTALAPLSGPSALPESAEAAPMGVFTLSLTIIALVLAFAGLLRREASGPTTKTTFVAARPPASALALSAIDVAHAANAQPALAAGVLPVMAAAHAPMRAAALPSKPVHGTSHRAPSEVEASVPHATASLRLTADPPASVTLSGPDGAQTYRTPVESLEVSAGNYTLTFNNDTYGEPVVTRVALDASARRAVHVDFREAEPRVSIR